MSHLTRVSCVLAIGAIFLLALAAVRTVIVGGEVAGWDHSFHYTNAYLTYLYFLPEGHPVGYDSWHMYGWCPNLYYNPGTTLFVALAQRWLAPLLGPKSVYSLCVALSYALMAPAAAGLAHALTGSQLAAVTAALASVAVFDEENAWTDAGWRQVYYVGMWPQRWGLVTGFASAALLAYALGARGARRYALLALSSILMAWSLLSHVMMGVATAIFAALIGLLGAFRAAALGRGGESARTLALVAAWLLWALALSAFWAVPLLATNAEYHGLRTLTWEVGVGVVWAVLRSYPPYLNLLAAAGPALPLVRQGERSPRLWLLYALWAFLAAAPALSFARLIPLEWMGTLTLLSLIPAALLLSSNGWWPGLTLLPASVPLMLWLATGPRTYVILLPVRVDFSGLPLIEWFGYGKFAGYARYLALVSSSVSASALLSWALERLRGGAAGERQVAALTLVSLGFACVYWPALAGLARNTDLLPASRRFRFIEEFPLYANISRFVDSLSKLGLGGNTYLLVQDLSDNFADWATFCHNHFVYEIPLYTGIPIVGGIVWTRYVTQPISTTEYSRLFTVDIGYWARNVEEFHRQLEELGISYVATFDRRLIEALRSSPLFEEVLYEPPYALFRTRAHHPIITASGGAAVEDVVIRPNLIRFTLRAAPLHEYEVRIRLVLFPGLRVRAIPEPVSLTVARYNPWVAGEVSRAWGYPVGSRVPFIRLTLAPLSERTVVEVRYEAGSWGDAVSAAALVLAVAALLLPPLKGLAALAALRLKAAALRRSVGPSVAAAPAELRSLG